MPAFRVITLGCPRNLVDSEVIAGLLRRAGFRPVSGLPADICVVNTCAFIHPAREESIDTILHAIEEKRKGRIGLLVVCGCLAQRDGRTLARELEEVDVILGAGDFHRLPALARRAAQARKRLIVSKPPAYLYDDRTPRLVSTPRQYAYIKVAEGCSNRCSYCIISRLRGPCRSRARLSVLREARKLARGGALREIVLVGQDTTAYGIDRYGAPALPSLLSALATDRLDGVGWIRLLYTHPAHYTEDLIRVVRDEPKICKYLDLPVQHIRDAVLRRMRRGTTQAGILALIERLRREIPGLTLRTSIIVGFPGETDRDFRRLIDFVRETRFERLGAFLYSREEKTAAAAMKGQVPEKVKRERLDELMKLQRTISLEKNRSRVGTTARVLIDERCPGRKGVYAGRTEGDAPEIDGSVFVHGKGVRVGEFCTVNITDAMEYDLVGKVIHLTPKT